MAAVATRAPKILTPEDLRCMDKGVMDNDTADRVSSQTRAQAHSIPFSVFFPN